jgi:putative ABC transport system permease protein
MFRNYMTVALRNIARHRLYSFINIAGLAVGLASAILILLLVRDEVSYDRWIPGSENLYRAGVTFSVPGRENISIAPAMFPLAPGMKADIPQVQDATRIGTQQSAVRYGDKNFFEEVQIADSNFFQVVQLPLVKGNPAQVLQHPNSAVISESVARKYFGDADPIGKVVQLDAGPTVQITGVMRDLPTNTHLKVDFVIPILSKAARNAPDEMKRPRWTSANWYTYVRVTPGTDPKVLLNGIAGLFRKNVNPKEFGLSQDISELLKPVVIPFNNIHLGSNVQAEMKPNSDWTTVYGFAAIAGLILLIACINFMNLATARAMQRSREVSLRKVVGAERRQLIVQFLGESVLLSVLALVLALAFVEIVLPYFGQYLDRDIALNYLGDWDVSLGVLALAVLAGILGGLYPAFIISGFRPALVLKANRSGQSGSGTLRSALVVMQFAISIGLGIATSVVYGQTIYARNLELGFARDNTLILTGIGRDQVAPTRESMRAELVSNPDIAAVTGSNEEPFGGNENNDLITSPASPGDAILIRQHGVEPDYFTAYNVPLVAGRYLDRNRGEDQIPVKENDEIAPDNRSIIINASAVKRLGFKSPQDAVGQVVRSGTGPDGRIKVSRTIVGVVADANFDSLRSPVLPTVYTWNPHGLNHYNIRVRPGRMAEAKAFVERTWNKFVPSLPVRLAFLDENYEEQFAADEKRGQMFAAFSAIAIFIACLGLFGLASYTAERRTKEIGIRKVFGASVTDVVKMLVWQFSIPILIANLIAWPVAYYYLNGWLEKFAYRIDLSPFFFVGAALVALLIGWATVSVQAVRAARSRPVNALRYE